MATTDEEINKFLKDNIQPFFEKDVVIGCITRYEWKDIEPWVISLERSGFKGLKVMIILEGKKDLVDKLASRGFAVVGFKKEENGDLSYTGKPYSIVVNRFLHIHELLTNYEKSGVKIRYVIAPDVKDVIFQSDPSEWLEKHLIYGKSICVGSESLQYQHEEWGKMNMLNSFPMFASGMMEKPIYNAGTIAGKFNDFKDLCANVYLASIGNPLHNPDQAALNILLNFDVYRYITLFNNQEDGWAAQLGTTADPNKMDSFRPHLLGPEPAYMDGEWMNTKGEKFVLVHQWDRTPYAEIIRRKYHE